MPETALYEYYGVVPWQDYIRFTRQVLSMQAVSVAQLKEFLSEPDFWFRVLSLNCRHIAATGFAIVNVSHVQAAALFRTSVFCFAAKILGFIIFATALNTGTATELPNCL